MTQKTIARSAKDKCLAAPPVAALESPHALWSMPGFVYGARILTMKGARRIEDLRPGDYVITRGQGAVPIRLIEQRSMVVPAVYIIAGSLGHHQPDLDSLLPASQTVLLRDWRARAFAGAPETMVTVDRLVDGEFVRDVGLQTLTLYSVFCSAPQVLYADGMELGTADTSIPTPALN
ncbi:hypothetical protein CEP88_02795 [Roseobacter denitrificans]|uniref:Conserved domain protein n=1 Tax=Roseobacter denitrificans (strain ATCC 33942 / OCh 114) TaxID=375451 RepID=Q166G5_ROSDO|nr:Hint domain-containing protein [Roseobacter denitrificans]ABG32128.1 conserved domain protein [Roseobacter denitrificans OCh 114]AVL54724.1 hypothetical protein CEP88_02795 [Roseobacter denitrificans]SFF77730.1 Hint domain-containing protein [Roseobacter denitrificans OCh 114]